MSRGTLTDDISRVLREEVLRGQYRAGERLPSERDLAARFETTRGVVRVALKRLEQLGIAEVKPGGARVVPLAEASLEAVGYLLALDELPDGGIVDQILETVGALVAASGRRLVEDGTPEQISEAREVIASMRRPETTDQEMHDLIHRLGHVVMDSNGNLVMTIVQRSLRTEVIAHLQERGLPIADDRVPSNVSRSELVASVERIEKAIGSRDGLAGYSAAHDLWSLFRRSVRELIDAAQPSARPAVPLSERPSEPGDRRAVAS